MVFRYAVGTVEIFIYILQFRYWLNVCAIAPLPEKRTTEACMRQTLGKCQFCAQHFGGTLSDTMFWAVSSSLAPPLYSRAHPCFIYCQWSLNILNPRFSWRPTVLRHLKA